MIPCGGLSTQARLELLLDAAATIVCCTPTYALRMQEVAQSGGIRLADANVRVIIVAGEPGGSLPFVRQRIEAAFVPESWTTPVPPRSDPGGMEIQRDVDCGSPNAISSPSLFRHPPQRRSRATVRLLKNWCSPHCGDKACPSFVIAPVTS